MQYAIALEGAGYRTLPVARYRNNSRQRAIDKVAEEVPVALVYNGLSHAVMMATPLDLEAFAVGFSLTEGIVGHNAEIHDMEVGIYDEAAEVRLEISERAFAAMKARKRSLAGRTGCGVCGIESLQALELAPERVPHSKWAFDLSSDVIGRVASNLRPYQRLMQETGGVHAAAWCTPDGDIRYVFEDVGRHNALDKLVGHLAMQRISTGSGFVFMTSRASYELVRKAARLGIPALASISAPSSLAIRIAEQAGIRLMSFCRHDGYVDYLREEHDSGT